MPAVPGFLELAKPNMANNRPSRRIAALDEDLQKNLDEWVAA